MQNFQLPTQFEIGTIKIDNQDIIGLYISIEIFESIYMPAITGSITLADTDVSNFVETYKIEGIEPIELMFTNALNEKLMFKGFLNGMRDKITKNQNTIYTFDFHSQTIRKNEQEFITERFDQEKPEDIVTRMIKKIGGDIDKLTGTGQPMSFLGSRRRPNKIIEYILRNAVSGNASVADNDRSQKNEVKGSGGFLCWQTLNGYRFASINDLKSGKAGKDGGKFVKRVENRNLSMTLAMQGIISHEFEKIGDLQTKLRSGAFKHTMILFDIDKGLYKEFVYEDDSNMTKKTKEIVKKPSRYLYRVFNNERFQNDCEKASDNLWDQTKLSVSQNLAGQNTFDDSIGTFIIPPHYNIHAGDTIEVLLPKVVISGIAEYDKIYSGRYVVRQIGHHMFSDGRSYTQIKTIRSTIQTDDASSTKTSTPK